MSWPLVLPHDQIARMKDRNASLLVLTRRLRVGRIEVQDALVVRRNTAHRKSGRQDLQTDPTVFGIEIMAVEKAPLLDLDLATIRRTGHRTSEDFFGDWRVRRRHLDGLEAYLHAFRIAEDARFLHRAIHRGYTSEPGEGVGEEQQALSRDDLARYAHDAFTRDDAIRRARVKASMERISTEVSTLRADLAVVGGAGRRVERALGSVERIAGALRRAPS